MRKIFILIVLIAFNTIYPQSLFIPDNGGAARVSSLGQNPYITDPENMRNNPAWGSYYRNMVGINYGIQPNSGQHIGANIGCGDVFTIGAFYNRNSSGGIYPLTIDNLNVLHIDENKNYSNYEIFTSAAITPAITLGGGFALADIADYDVNKKKYGLNLGAIIKVQENIIIDAAANMNLPYSFDYNTDKIEISRSSYNLRVFYLQSPKLTLVSQINHNKFNEDYTTDEYKTNIYIDYTEIKAGLIYKNDLALLSGGVGYSIVGTNNHLSADYAVINIGAELYISKFFIPRIGYDGKYFTKTNPFQQWSNIDLGAGINIYKFQLDGFYSYDFKHKETSKYNGVYLSLSYKN